MKLRLLTSEEAENYRNIIDGYHPSAQTVYNFARSKFAVIAGPTGVGKDTVRNALAEHGPEFVKILSSTSRPMRNGEQDDVDYHFRELEYFEEGLTQRRFLQAALVHKQQISCLDITEIAKLNEAQIGISILIVQTEQELRSLNSDLKTIFLVPPSLPALLSRMHTGKEITSEETKRRLEAAKTELEIALRSKDYYCIINGDINQTIESARNFLVSNQRNEAGEQAARQTIQTVLGELSSSSAVQ